MTGRQTPGHERCIHYWKRRSYSYRHSRNPHAAGSSNDPIGRQRRASAENWGLEPAPLTFQVQKGVRLSIRAHERFPKSVRFSSPTRDIGYEFRKRESRIGFRALTKAIERLPSATGCPQHLARFVQQAGQVRKHDRFGTRHPTISGSGGERLRSAAWMGSGRPMRSFAAVPCGGGLASRRSHAKAGRSLSLEDDEVIAADSRREPCCEPAKQH